MKKTPCPTTRPHYDPHRVPRCVNSSSLSFPSSPACWCSDALSTSRSAATSPPSAPRTLRRGAPRIRTARTTSAATSSASGASSGPGWVKRAASLLTASSSHNVIPGTAAARRPASMTRAAHPATGAARTGCASRSAPARRPRRWASPASPPWTAPAAASARTLEGCSGAASRVSSTGTAPVGQWACASKWAPRSFAPVSCPEAATIAPGGMGPRMRLR